MDVFTFLILAAFSSIIFLGASVFLKRRLRPEPPIVSPLTPVIGHLLGILKNPQRYISDISLQNGHPIFQLSLGLSSIYVIQDPSLLSEIDRDSRTFSLWPVEVSSLSALGNMSKHTTAFFQSEAFHTAWSKRLRRDVMTGPPLRELVEATTNRLNFELSLKVDNQYWETELFEWTRRCVTRATMSAMYGPQNPYDSPEVEAALFDWLGDSSWMMLGPAARLLAPKAFRARSIVVSALSQYFERGHHKDASLAVKDRQRLYQDKISYSQQGNIEATLASALVGNTFTSAFWAVFDIWSNNDLFNEVRNSVDNITRSAADPKPDISRLINAKKPRFIDSVVLESLRCNSGAASSRQIMSDTVIGNYTLKKGRLIFAPLNAVHHHESWGSSAHDFDPRRFEKGMPDRSSFRAFGAGPFTCPGQNLARSMISTFIVLLCLRFDMKPLSDKGWVRPELAQPNFFEIMPSPKPTTKVAISLRRT